jgi:hypothetical protein
VTNPCSSPYSLLRELAHRLLQVTMSRGNIIDNFPMSRIRRERARQMRSER